MRELTQETLREAILEAAKNSKYGKDPEHPDRPGSLTRFFTSIADQNIAVFCLLLGQLIQADTQTDESVEPQYVEKSTDVRLQ